MLNRFYQSLESISASEWISLQDCVEHLSFNDQGLIPVVTQHRQKKDALMHAWMKRGVIEKTLAPGLITYWSRSCKMFWVNGESSGHAQQLVAMGLDSDGGIFVCPVKQTWTACHTSGPNYFYLQVDIDSQVVQLYRPAQNTGNQT